MISLNYFVFGNSNHVTKRHGVGYNIASVIIMVLKLLICVWGVYDMLNTESLKCAAARVLYTIITCLLSIYVMIAVYPYAAASTLVYDFVLLVIFVFVMSGLSYVSKDFEEKKEVCQGQQIWSAVVGFVIPFVVFFAAWLFVICNRLMLSYVIDFKGLITHKSHHLPRLFRVTCFLLFFQ